MAKRQRREVRRREPERLPIDVIDAYVDDVYTCVFEMLIENEDNVLADGAADAARRAVREFLERNY